MHLLVKNKYFVELEDLQNGQKRYCKPGLELKNKSGKAVPKTLVFYYRVG